MVSGAVTAGAIVDRDLLAAARAGTVLGGPARVPRPSGDWDPLTASRRPSRRTSPPDIAAATRN